MPKINMKDYYPCYDTDLIVDVSEEIAVFLYKDKLKENAYNLRTYRHKAYYSLNRGDGIENAAIFTALSPDEIFQKRLTYEQLYSAISSLPEKQAKRIYAHYFLGLKKSEIAKAEGVNSSQISKTITKGLINMKKYLKKYL